METLKISESAQKQLRCPACRAALNLRGDHFSCTNVGCGISFPILNGIPVLINDKNSVFSISDFVSQRNTTFDLHRSRVREFISRMIPSIGWNVRGKENYEKLGALLATQPGTPRVLVIGGSILGKGMGTLAQNRSLDWVESDVSMGPRTMLICDGHDLPFEDETFDAVIVQAVLEHVADPYRCASEVRRVLKKQGLVYAETPFMQQVHEGAYDFTRFTHLGHRRLFRGFDEIDSGAVCGPGMALAWSYQYFLLSFTTSRTLRSLIRMFAGLTSFFLKYFDPYLVRKAGAYDAASGFFFMGRKGEKVLSDRELIAQYRGAL
jgi:SAM-dependent methyltransferase